MRSNSIPRQKMDFSSKYMTISAFLMGLSVFLRCLYFTGLNSVSVFSGGELFLSLFLPLVLCGSYIAMTSALQRNVPMIYLGLGALICLMAILWSFFEGSILRVLFSVLFYGAGAALLLCILLGILRDNRLAVAVLGLSVVLRVLLWDLHGLDWKEWILELSVLSALTSVCLVPLTVQAVHRKA